VAVAGCSGQEHDSINSFLDDPETVCDEFTKPIVVDGELAVVVDGRCDTDPDYPVYFYTGPEQLEDRDVSSADTGDAFPAECIVPNGQSRSSFDPRTGERQSSSEWVKVVLPSGNEAYVPGVWVQGDQSEAIASSDNC
jgi:hypothetical protein